MARENPHEPARNCIDLEKLAKLDSQFNKVMRRIPKPGETPPPAVPDDVSMLQFLSLTGISSMDLLKQALEERAAKDKEGR